VSHNFFKSSLANLANSSNSSDVDEILNNIEKLFNFVFDSAFDTE